MLWKSAELHRVQLHVGVGVKERSQGSCSLPLIFSTCWRLGNTFRAVDLPKCLQFFYRATFDSLVAEKKFPHNLPSLKEEAHRASEKNLNGALKQRLQEMLIILTLVDSFLAKVMIFQCLTCEIWKVVTPMRLFLLSKLKVFQCKLAIVHIISILKRFSI